MSKEMTTHVTKGFFDAECQDCGGRWRERNALGVAAKHARKTGHYVRVDIERAVIYNMPAPERESKEEPRDR